MVQKKDKLNGILQREISDILQKEVRDREIGFCTITAVDITSDLSIAKIHVTFLPKSHNAQKGIDALERSKGFIRSLLSKRLTIRRVPELKFMLDTSLEYGNKIENIIKDINSHEK